MIFLGGGKVVKGTRLPRRDGRSKNERDARGDNVITSILLGGLVWPANPEDAILFCLRYSALLLALLPATASRAETPLPAPGFHHIHLNSTDPAAAADFYVAQFPASARTTFAGLPALKTGNIYLLFTKVKQPPATRPQTALWHFGWQVADIHKKLALFEQRPEVRLLPLYVKDESGSVAEAKIAETKAQPGQPIGFAFLAGPEEAIIEYQGNFPSERINHLHMFQKDPFCAELWYHQHLNAPSKSTYTEADCKVPGPAGPSWPAFERGGMLRQPAGVTFDEISVTWHVQQDETPLAPTRGHLLDHYALSVADLDAWIAKLRRERVRFLTKPYKLGGLRAVMIEGPSREAIELVQISAGPGGVR